MIRRLSWIILRWALKAITNILRREMQREILRQRREGDVTTKAEVELMWPQAKEYQQLPEAGRNKE